jgi:hypothetical protein
MRQAGQSSPVVISEPQAPSAELPPKQTVLLDQIRKCRPLAALQPAGQHHQYHLGAEKSITRRQVIS